MKQTLFISDCREILRRLQWTKRDESEGELLEFRMNSRRSTKEGTDGKKMEKSKKDGKGRDERKKRTEGVIKFSSFWNTKGVALW